MSNRRIPGFTAETSIYSSANHYSISSAGVATPSILPQLRKFPGGGDCIPGCICVSPINCPCCDTLWPFPFPGQGVPADPSGTLGPLGSM
jgi:hypothetical protein